MNDPEELLKRNSLFKAANEEEIKKLAAGAVIDTTVFETGARIYDPDGPKKAVGIVRSGRVNVFRRSDESVLLNTLGPGEVFGIAGLFAAEGEEGNGAVTEIVAASNSEIWFIDGETVRQMIRENPDFAESYIAYLSRKVRFLNRRIADFTAADAEMKTGRYLEQLCRGICADSHGAVSVSNQRERDLNEDGGNDFVPSFKINMSRLARTLDIGRASLYRALDSLESAGIIRRSEGRVEIIDCEALKRMCR